MSRISEDDLLELAEQEVVSIPKGTQNRQAVVSFISGYRTAEEKWMKQNTKLRTLLKQHRIMIDALCNEKK